MICNPLDLSYRFSDLTVGPFYRAVMREAADPSLVLFKDRYYLFPSMSGGFWHSGDLVEWTFVATPTLPTYDYAPDVREIDGALVVCASRSSKPCSFYRTSDPLAGSWEELPGTFPFFDPSLFQDDDGRIYLYWGTSNKTPIRGQELDRATFAPIGEPIAIISSDDATRGWEHPGENYHASESNMGSLMQRIAGSDPYIEGAWMTKHGGSYYLQYAAPGTQFNTYADGYFISQSPLGPFSYSTESPFSSKPGGFMTGAGHGSTIQDRYGNWWHTSTMRISVNQMFERRVGLWPAGFDKDGVLFCNQEFADYPMTVPAAEADPWSLTAKSMLLSFKRPVTASSEATDHPADLAVNEDARTWWVAGTAASGEWISVELADGASVSAIQINLADHEVRPPRHKRSETRQTLLWRRHIDMSEPAVSLMIEASADGENWDTIENTSDSGLSRTHLYIQLPNPQPYRFVRVTASELPYGSTFAVSGIRVFGRGSGKAPSPVTPSAERTAPTSAALTWDSADGAHGYNIRYGLSENKLYHSWLLYEHCSLSLDSLNAGVDYWIAVDSFNENGITRGTPIRVAATPAGKVA